MHATRARSRWDRLAVECRGTRRRNALVSLRDGRVALPEAPRLVTLPAELGVVEHAVLGARLADETLDEPSAALALARQLVEGIDVHGRAA
jgi:hypothetical protein